MKLIIPMMLALCAVSLNAQDLTGIYKVERHGTTTSLSRTLTLNADGTFEFYAYKKHERRIPNDVHLYGKGTWTIDKKVITFSTETLDLDEKYTLNFNSSKARFDTKSPRDTSNRTIKTSIRFYDSEVLIAKGLKLIKD
ncbi:hypothetical protein [Psychroserpens sp. SPM9]|uniref:hypothetical protein n=1 Tax=Psychroserpens sp. SPM9 TaxID=2975598 RepID=UPI0021A8BAC3|nr:hypothetical protein [Psychroserpens sp. SPM9]MDG5490567.1 hypothetical protein [Psychroserpens sp. SPM9]